MIRKTNGSLKPAVISAKVSDELENELIQAAYELGLSGNKSALLNDICASYLAQRNRRSIPMTRVERAERTRQLVEELKDLWLDDPERRVS